MNVDPERLNDSLHYAAQWGERQLDRSEHAGMVMAVSYLGHELMNMPFGTTRAAPFLNENAAMFVPPFRAPMTRFHRFWLCSQTKTVTAMAILRLQQQGALNVEDSLGRHLLRRDLPFRWLRGHWLEGIRIRQVLNNTSGLERDGSFADAWQTGRFPTAEEFLEDLRVSQPIQTGGTEGMYSNSSSLLYWVILAAAEEDPLAFAKRAILRPLRMHDTGFDLDPTAAARVGQPDSLNLLGYAREQLQRVEHPAVFTGGWQMAAALHGTPSDQAKLGWELSEANPRPRVLTPEARRLMGRLSVPILNYPGWRFGLGLALNGVPDGRRVQGWVDSTASTRGGGLGFRSDTVWDDHGLVVSVAGNGEIDAVTIAHGVWEIVATGLTATRRPFLGPPESKDELRGVYVSVPDNTYALVGLGAELFRTVVDRGTPPFADRTDLVYDDSGVVRIDATNETGWGSPGHEVRVVPLPSGSGPEVVAIKWGTLTLYPEDLRSELAASSGRQRKSRVIEFLTDTSRGFLRAKADRELLDLVMTKSGGAHNSVIVRLHQRISTLAERLAEVLREQRPEMILDAQWELAHGVRGFRLPPHRLWGLLVDTLDDVGSEALDNGADQRDVSQMLGHFQTYAPELIGAIAPDPRLVVPTRELFGEMGDWLFAQLAQGLGVSPPEPPAGALRQVTLSTSGAVRQ